MARLPQLAHFLHAQLLWLLVIAYALAALAPGPGLAFRSISFGSVRSSFTLSLPIVLLAVLLFNAGLGTRVAALRHVRQSGLVLMAGTIANLLVPVVAIFIASFPLRLWHNPDEVQNVLTGMALVASMPIAGSSTAWTQNAEGNLTVSLGLVLLSTCLSPITTPLLLDSASWMTEGDYSEDLRELAAQGTGQLLLLVVLMPSLLGMWIGWLIGVARSRQIQPGLKVANTLALLTLCYMNAAVSLPQVVQQRDPDFLLLVSLVTFSVCAVNFGSGWFLARLLRLDRAQQAALVFGLGMSNNGTGMVIATGALAAHPFVLLPILFYNLVQHFVASIVDRLLFRT